jgi:hypothetical protein
VSQDVPDIVRRMSPWELCAYRRIGGYVPADLLRRIAGGGERIRDEDPSNVAARGPAGRPGNRCKGPVVTNEGDEWATAEVAAEVLRCRVNTVHAACRGDHLLRGLELFWRAEAPAVVLALVARRSSPGVTLVAAAAAAGVGAAA